MQENRLLGAGRSRLSSCPHPQSAAVSVGGCMWLGSQRSWAPPLNYCVSLFCLSEILRRIMRDRIYAIVGLLSTCRGHGHIACLHSSSFLRVTDYFSTKMRCFFGSRSTPVCDRSRLVGDRSHDRWSRSGQQDSHSSWSSASILTRLSGTTTPFCSILLQSLYYWFLWATLSEAFYFALVTSSM